MRIKKEETTNEQLDEEGNPIESENTETIITETAAEDYLRVSDFDKSIKPYLEEDELNNSSSDTTIENGNEETDYKVSINGEFVANGFNDNTIRFEKGTVGLYRNNYSGENLSNESYNSGTSLFFITTDEDSSLNGEYAAFGKVIKGLDIVEKMINLPTEEDEKDDDGNTTASSTIGTLSENQEIKKFKSDSFPIIKKATVETFGVNYEMPKYEKAFDYNQYMSDLILQYYRNQQ